MLFRGRIAFGLAFSNKLPFAAGTTVLFFKTAVAQFVNTADCPSQSCKEKHFAD